MIGCRSAPPLNQHPIQQSSNHPVTLLLIVVFVSPGCVKVGKEQNDVKFGKEQNGRPLHLHHVGRAAACAVATLTLPHLTIIAA